MKYRLDEIAQLCSEHGIDTHRPDESRIDIQIHHNCILSFLNIDDEDDTLLGFDGTPWHSHGIVQFMTGPNTFIKCDELDIIIGLVSGELLIVTQHINSSLADRWIVHKGEKLDLKYIEPGEEMCVYRLP